MKFFWVKYFHKTFNLGIKLIVFRHCNTIGTFYSLSCVSNKIVVLFVMIWSLVAMEKHFISCLLPTSSVSSFSFNATWHETQLRWMIIDVTFVNGNVLCYESIAPTGSNICQVNTKKDKLFSLQTGCWLVTLVPPTTIEEWRASSVLKSQLSDILSISTKCW